MYALCKCTVSKHAGVSWLSHQEAKDQSSRQKRPYVGRLTSKQYLLNSGAMQVLTFQYIYIYNMCVCKYVYITYKYSKQYMQKIDLARESTVPAL